SASGDQKRVMTPALAIEAGADYLVVGRPIVEAADPKKAADAIVAEIEQATTKKGEENAEGVLDWPHRCERRGGLQALRRRQRTDLQEIRRQADRARRAIRLRGGQRPVAQRGDRIPRPGDREGLLSLARISGEHQAAAALFDRRYHHYRGLRRIAVTSFRGAAVRRRARNS